MFQGLPNTFGGYDETPEVTAKHIKVWNISRDCVISDIRVDKNSLLVFYAYLLQYCVLGLFFFSPQMALYGIWIVYIVCIGTTDGDIPVQGVLPHASWSV